MIGQPQTKWTAEEYLAFERASEVKHEFLDGELFARAGVSRQHGRIGWNVVAALGPQLRESGCEGFVGDMRLRIPATDLFTYPDVVIVCGEPQFEDDAFDTLLNPTVIVEILSPRAEDYDRGRKFAHYRTLPSLTTYLLIAQDRVHVERFVRQAEGQWVLSETDDPDAVVELPGAGAKLALREVYRRVFGEP